MRSDYIFALCLLVLLTTTKIIKNIYSRNNVCFGVCEMVFMCIISFKNYF